MHFNIVCGGYHRLICHNLEIGSDLIQIDYQTDSLFASRRAGDNYRFSSVSLKPFCLSAEINVSSTIHGWKLSPTGSYCVGV